MKVRAYVDYQERTNTHVYRDFEVLDQLPEIGDTIGGRVLKSIDSTYVDRNYCFSDEQASYDYYELHFVDDVLGDEDVEYIAVPIPEPEFHRVEFLGGESRKNPGLSCNYMLVTLDNGEELYAEYVYPEGTTYEDEDYDDFAGFDECKSEILAQAKEYGLDEYNFDF